MSRPPNQFFLPPNHFLSLPRSAFPDPRDQTYDTSTLAAADFDVDTRTGFMPPRPPIAKLPIEFDDWEVLLQRALGKLRLGEEADVSAEERKYGETWREDVRKLRVIPTTSLTHNELLLRRAHHVLSFLMHMYIHSQPPSLPHVVPSSLSVPLISVSKELGLRPIMTYADTVPWNFSLINPDLPLSSSNIHHSSLLSGTPDENHFYLTSSLIELRGVEALQIMRQSLDEAFLGDSLALRRITGYLKRLGKVIEDMTGILMKVRDGCDPGVFYSKIRPWFKGGASTKEGWTYEGVDESDSEGARFLGGPSAGQSSLIHALDLFLGVDHNGTSSPDAPPASTSNSRDDNTFLARQEQYMPRHHRAFLHHLRSQNTPIRQLLTSPYIALNPEYTEAYNEAVIALKKFRDGHIRIATLYIVSQARREGGGGKGGEVKGTGGTSLVPFLKASRDDTERSLVGEGEKEKEKERITQRGGI